VHTSFHVQYIKHDLFSSILLVCVCVSYLNWRYILPYKFFANSENNEESFKSSRDRLKGWCSLLLDVRFGERVFDVFCGWGGGWWAFCLVAERVFKMKLRNSNLKNSKNFNSNLKRLKYVNSNLKLQIITSKIQKFKILTLKIQKI
jgi:hypothetical protein